MKYKDYDISKNKQVLRCLTCDNEDIDFNNDKYAFCHICGSPVINKCLNKNEKTQCGKSLPANARFCPYCGSETLFYEKGLLKAWKKKHLLLVLIQNYHQKMKYLFNQTIHYKHKVFKKIYTS